MYVSTEKTASFGYEESIDDKLAKTLLECISKNVGLFQSYGHRVGIEKLNFGATKGAMLKAGVCSVHTASNQHERHIERHIRTIQDGVKAMLAQIKLEYKLPAVFYPKEHCASTEFDGQCQDWRFGSLPNGSRSANGREKPTA